MDIHSFKAQVLMFGFPSWYLPGVTKQPFYPGDKVRITSLNGVRADKETVAMLRKTWIVESCTPAYVDEPLWDIDLLGNQYMFTNQDIEKEDT